MSRSSQYLIFGILSLGLTTNAELGCDDDSLLHWPGFLLIGMAGFLSCALWGRQAWGERLPSLTCVGSLVVFAVWIAVRGYFSPVNFLARSDLALIAVAGIVYVMTSTTFASAVERVDHRRGPAGLREQGSPALGEAARLIYSDKEITIIEQVNLPLPSIRQIEIEDVEILKALD